MDFKKIVLYVALFLLMLALYQKWRIDYPLEATPATATQTASPVQPSSGQPYVPQVTSEGTPATPKATLIPSDRIISVKTDVLEVSIDKVGGTLAGAKLLEYPDSDSDKKNPYTVLADTTAKTYIAQSDLVTEGAKSNEPITYDSLEKNYQLKQGDSTLTVTLSGKNNEGLEVKKIYTFTKGKYFIDIQYQLNNASTAVWKGQIYSQFTRKQPVSTSGMFGISAYDGASISDPIKKPYEKISYSDMTKNNLDQTIKGGWAAMQEHYFVSAWIPEANNTYQYYSRALGDNLYTLGMLGPKLEIAPQASKTATLKFYVGPEITEDLKNIAPNLDYTIDYGKLWIISSALFWLLSHIYQIVGNWGVAIVLVTILIKLMFFTLSNKSFRSMAVMRTLQPKIESLKQKFGDDKQGLQRATMELYRQEKVNPFSGCWPMLVQIPFFIGLYWVLIESVELRQAPFFGWIQDLSAADPYRILPIIMGISMLIQQKLNPPPPDPAQAKMMMILPVVFTGLFWYFPSGLVLYWTVNQVFTICHQWYAMRQYNGKQLVAKRAT